MIIKNKLDKTFGSQMAFSGWVLLAFGAIFIFDVMGIILVITGFMLATTVDGVCIDSRNRRIKRYSGPFGFPVKCKTRHRAIAKMDELAELLHWMVWTTEEK